MIADPTNDQERLLNDVLSAWLRTCEDDGVSLEDFGRLGETVAELLRLAQEGVTVQELRLIASARLVRPGAAS